MTDPVEMLLRASIRRSVRGGLGGVGVRGPLPPGGAVLAANHHSWWDGYVWREVAWAVGADFRVLMTRRQLARFPFLRRVGALDVGELRAALRAARAGAWVAIFPEGGIQPAGPLREVQPGAAWLAGAAGVPLVPAGLRVVVRGNPQPEAYLRLGAPVAGPDLAAAISRQLAALDDDLAASDPDRPLAGYLRLCGRRRDPEHVDLPSRLLARMTEDR